MPVYSMNCFQLPKELCYEIDSMIARFWWGSTKEKRKISWISWKKLTKPKREGGLGFRDLHQFNQALLANQVWKIMQRPNSLVYKMLKARYFRSRHILTANQGAKASYGWNSLRFGAEQLKKGVQIQIGDGENTKIGTDPWLPTCPPRPPLLRPTIDPETHVSTLVWNHTHQWNERKLEQFIEPCDHHLIHKIFLPAWSTCDKAIWSYTLDGRYNVKSGYWLAASSELEEDDPQPPLSTYPDIAKHIWSLNIAPKLKHFVWKIASCAVGVASNLRHRNINVNPYFPRCCSTMESSDHAFFTCDYAKAVWRATGLPTITLCDPTIPIEEKIREIINIHNNKQIADTLRIFPAWILWRIWKSQNDLLFNKKNITVADTIKRANADTKEWLDVRDKETCGRTSVSCIPRSQKQQWKAPTTGWLKCNYDVSHHEGTRISRLGWIIQDSNGVVKNCRTGKFQGRHTIEEAECTTLIWALQVTWALGYRCVEFEDDNQNINRTINDNLPNLRLQHYIETIKRWSDMFTMKKFTFKPREHNKCADVLAKKVISCIYDWSLYKCCPNYLLSVVNNDAFLAN